MQPMYFAVSAALWIYKMRIAFILYDFDLGGMPTWIYSLASKIHLSHELHFICTHVNRISPKFLGVGQPCFVGRNRLSLIRYLISKRIQVVQYGQQRLFGDCALAAGVPVVLERTDGWRQGSIEQSKRWLDAVVSSTKGTLPLITEITGPDRVHLIYNGVDISRFQNAKPDRLGFADEDILVGRVSRFSGGKNLELLIDAMRVLKERYSNVKLILVGANSRMPGAEDYESILRDRAVGMEHCVRFVGQIEKPESIIAGFDIGTCVSRRYNEGIPNSLMECMAAGKPVVATAVDDIPELVINDETGLLIEDNDLNQLVGALETLIKDLELRRRLGVQGNQYVQEHFNLALQAEKYVTLYEALFANARNSSLGRRATKIAFGWSQVVAPHRVLSKIGRLVGLRNGRGVIRERN